LDPTPGAASPQGLQKPSPRRSGEWRQEYELAKRVHPEGLAWTSALTLETFRPTLWRLLNQVVTGDSEAHWMVRSQGHLIAFLWVLQRFGTAQALSVVHPDWQGQVEAVLISHALRAGAWDQEFALEASQGTDEESLVHLGFRKGRTLVWMAKDLGAPQRNEAVGSTPQRD
jgi:hypothetical protein